MAMRIAHDVWNYVVMHTDPTEGLDRYREIIGCQALWQMTLASDRSTTD